MEMGKVKNLIISSNPTYEFLLQSLKFKTKYDWLYLDDRSKLTYRYLKSNRIKKIFITHWSYIIPKEIHNNFECILFHMTDLPYGRGGSPLQNLIKQGEKTTKISAIRIIEEVDSGPIYLKKELKLNGTAQNIFTRASLIIEEMIIEILELEPTPLSQKGKVTYFKRRTPKESNISGQSSLENLYDHIRMLDCDGYPRAFLEFEKFRIEFENAKFNRSKILKANVRIFKK